MPTTRVTENTLVYVRVLHKVPAFYGVRVKYTGPDRRYSGREGEIARAWKGLVCVRFDGERTAGPVDPLCLEYFTDLKWDDKSRDYFGKGLDRTPDNSGYENHPKNQRKWHKFKTLTVLAWWDPKIGKGYANLVDTELANDLVADTATQFGHTLLYRTEIKRPLQRKEQTDE